MSSITMRKTLSLFVMLLLIMVACNTGNLKTIKQKDEQGKLLEKYTVNKQTGNKEGLYQRYRPSGNIAEEATYRNGVLEGEHKFFQPSGTIESIAPYRNGKIEGVFKKYFESGTLEQEMPYQNGVLAGVAKIYYCSGTMKETVTFTENEENGPFQEWHENGNLKALGFYKNGDNEQDTLKLYDEAGYLMRTMYCEEGACRTLSKGNKSE